MREREGVMREKVMIKNNERERKKGRERVRRSIVRVKKAMRERMRERESNDKGQ